MLAQLQQRPDVVAAHVDRKGELLRIRLRAGTPAATIVAALDAMGFESVMDADIARDDRRWFGPTDVLELSGEEAEVLARRVVQAFAAAHGIGAGGSSALTASVADAVYATFVDHARGSAVAPSCAAAVAAATSPLIGPARAALLGAAVDRDLTGAVRD